MKNRRENSSKSNFTANKGNVKNLFLIVLRNKSKNRKFSIGTDKSFITFNRFCLQNYLDNMHR